MKKSVSGPISICASSYFSRRIEVAPLPPPEFRDIFANNQPTTFYKEPETNSSLEQALQPGETPSRAAEQ